jgi:hypothetical protein
MKRIFHIATVVLLLLTENLNAQIIKDSYSSSSKLSHGLWFRIAITADGIYRIDFSKLKQLGLTDPSHPRIFGNNSGQLSYFNDDPKPDDLKEIAVGFNKGSDGVFNEGDYLMFYAQGTKRWTYNMVKNKYDYLPHNYSDTAYYFLTSDQVPGKEITLLADTPLAADYTSKETDIFFVHEQDDDNLIRSGREWFQPVSSIHIDPGFADLLTSENVKYDIRVAARSSVPTAFRIYEENTEKERIDVQPVDLYDDYGTYAQISDSAGLFTASSSNPSYDIKFSGSGGSGAHGWLDRLTLQGRRLNTFSGSETQYCDSKSVAAGRIAAFSVRSTDIDPEIWDVTDPFNTRLVQYTRNGVDISFKAKTDTLRTFIAFTQVNVAVPLIKPVAIPNQDLHGSESADMVIITHALFKRYAEKLAAVHLKNDGLISEIVTPEQIYNEFSGGIRDIVAIRNFLRMKYIRQRDSSHPLKYLLLFGDGSYENRTPPPENPDYIPTYQSQNSTDVVSSFTSDDFFGLLDDGEGEAEGSLDIGIGRLPVSDTSQAGIVLSKIKKYRDPENMGDWKNLICLTADDEDSNTHMADAEGLASLLKDSVPVYNLDKIFLDAYKQTTTVNGQSYPDVNNSINNRINTGCLIFNYTGHGNESGFAAEAVVTAKDINSWNNGGKLPLFITATCEFSRFDDILLNVATHQLSAKQSGGEMVLLNRNGGGIALMSTTRVVYSAPNYDLNKNILSTAFNRDENGNALAFGDIIKNAKNNSGSGPNKRNFTLLGDPALKLAYPYYGRVVTDSVNNMSVNSNIDSLKALSLITVSGHIENMSGNTLSDFNGIISPVVYDKPNKIKTLANDGGQGMTFEQMNSILYSGKTLANNGIFKFTFIVPRDINYTYGNGKISYYASNGKEDMNGSFSDVIIGGFSKTMVVDTAGPDIKLYMNDTLFRNGGLTDNNPRLLAVLDDPDGINATGSAIGHDLTGFLDGNPESSIILNNYFENDFDNFKKGRISYDLNGLKEGFHYLTVKAWDNLNNSSEKTISFQVAGQKLKIRNLINYPNPFTNETRIILEHNRPDNELDIVVKIYNIDGKMIRILQTKTTPGGYTLPPLIWNGNEEGGQKAGKGIYPYIITITTTNGETAAASGRMIIL